MKEYVKPDVYYEDFELNRNVASCSVNGSAADAKSATNATSKSTCSFTITINTDSYVFYNNGSPCELSPESVGWEDYCYQTGQAYYTFFSS